MTLTTFYIKQHDRLPSLSATLKRLDGTVVDLTGGTVRFHMTRAVSGTPKVDADAVLVDAAAGQVRYDWGASDTDEIGTFKAEFEVTIGGKEYTFPNAGYFTVTVTDDIA